MRLALADAPEFPGNERVVANVKLFHLSIANDFDSGRVGRPFIPAGAHKLMLNGVADMMGDHKAKAVHLNAKGVKFIVHDAEALQDSAENGAAFDHGNGLS
jgi:hypothetical protein